MTLNLSQLALQRRAFLLLLALTIGVFSFSQTSIFSSSSTPASAALTDGQALEIGVKFRVTQAGYITGIRFYKGAANTGTHIGNLWSSTGTLLATATFINETSSGWQEVLFTTPVAVTTNTTYVASYFSSLGYYAITNPYFTAAVDNGPLHALANGEDGGNGVYRYTAASAFPNSTYQSSNYWVDVVYATSVTPDTTPPTVSLSAPAAGNVSGIVTVAATADDNIGVTGVQFLLNGANLGSEDLTAPYSYSWNTTSLANGSYTLTARARDAAGNTTTSAGVTVTVNNIVDNQPPSVTITSPAAGSVTGTISVTADASDNVSVAGVQFLLNGTNLGSEDITSPYSVSWNTADIANGNYILTARARDASGNVATSASVNVTVSNVTLIVGLPLSEGSGTTTADISGNSHPGTLVSSPSWGAGVYGQGLTFNGTSNYVIIPDHNDFTLDPAQNYTWSAWVKNSSFKEWSTVWSQTIDGSNFFYFYAHTSTDADGGPVTNGLSVYWWTNGGTNKVGVHSNNNVLTAGQWSYVAVTYNASQPQNNRFTIYVNGIDVTARTDVSSTGTLASINPTNIRVGSNQPFGEYLNGSVDEVRFYKRLLTGSEIISDMNTPLAPDVTNPTVSITSPAAGNVTGTINVTADASDNVGVVGVQFLLDGVNLGTEDLVAPYSVSWNTTTVTNGSHTLTAKARDAAGNITTSSGVAVTVNNDTQAPTVSISSPAAGNVSGTIDITADATDNIGVVGVQFLLDGVNLGTEDLVAPYSVSWNTTTVANGSHTLTAKARDAAGNITTSAAVIVNVLNTVPDTEAPIVSITAPAAGTVSGTINISANATDNIGIVGVQFLLNGADLGTEDISAPYTIPWNTTSVANGSYTLTARARDAAGNVTTSSDVVVTVNNDIQPPIVSITSPAAGTVSGNVSVTADASDNIAVVGVQFQLNGVNLDAEDIAAPYSVSWNTLSVANGSYTLTAIARDAAGNTTTSPVVTVTVSNDTQPPVVSISSPTGGSVSGTINVDAIAGDNIGVVGVQFLLDGNNLGAEDLTSPYSISWNTTTASDGSHTLTAFARDAAGNVTTSAAIVVTVSNDMQAPSVAITSPTGGTVSSTINIDATATDNIGVVGVQFLLDGNNLGTEDLTSPYSISWNTTTVSDGTHSITARARDASGNTTISVAVIVTVQNVIPDTQPPLVSITSPANGTGVSGTINVTANASDNIGVVGVQFLLDGVALGTEDVAAPYSISWTASSATIGAHTLSARARDAAGNSTTSAAITVNVIDNSLVAAFGFNEGTGTTAADQSSYNNNGTLTNGPTWSTSGKFGSAILFDGVNDFIDIADANSLDLTNGMTMEAWVNPSDVTGYKTVICKDRNTNSYTYTLAANNSTATVANQRPNSRIRANNTNRTVTGTSKLVANAWTHIASTYDGTTFRLYINGVQVSSLATTGSLTVTTNPLRIGGTTALSAQYFTGLIDEVRIYNRALSQAEIQADMITPIAPDNINPVVNITAPTGGTVSGTINVTADASDNTAVAGVQFFLDGVNLGTEDVTAPYSVSWNTATATNGSHVLTAKARDASGNVTTSSSVTITVDNDTQPPSVAITSPNSGIVNGTISIDANATDNIGVVGVQFQVDGVNTGLEDLAAPYSVSWNTTSVADGNHTLTAKARDAAGNVTTSAGVVITVQNTPPDTQAPTVSITSPAAGNVSGTINIAANASDNVGVVGVQFLLNGANLDVEDLASPYSISWNTTTVANGTYTLTARARDAAGNVTTSAGIVVTVNNDIQAPTVSITAPAAGNVSGTINVTASANDNVGVIGVQFLLNGANLDVEDVSSPYSISWNTTTVANGTYTLTARARDAAGNVTTSAGIVVTVNNDTQAPTVSITAPTAGNVTGTISVTATASDNIGVAGVQFLLSGNNLGTEVTSSPYSISWNTTTVPNGSYTLTARARDAAGNTTTSPGIAVTVNNASTLIVAMNMNEGTGTSAADVSGNNHSGTLSNSPTWSTGKYGQGLTFNGTSSYVNIPDHNDFTLDPAQSYTWSAWVKNNSFKEWSTVWSQTLNSSNFFYFYAHTSTDPDGGPVTNGISVYWWVNGGASKVGVHSSNNVLTAGQWSYVTVTYDASQTQSNRFSIYINGVDVTVRNDISSTGTLTSIDPTNIRVGSNQAFGEYLDGSVDEVRVYKRLLTSAEIIADMNSPIASTLVPTISPANGTTGVSIATTVTVTFNLAMDATTINSSTIELRTASNTLVPATVTYNATTRTATLTPTSDLSASTTYTTTVKGGSSGVKDANGNTLAVNSTSSFTTADPPPTEGHGGPILVVSSSANPFTRYTAEILRAEGLNEFLVMDISAVTSTVLNSYDVVILGDMTVTSTQVTMFTNWVNAGGTLISFRPNSLLNSLFGLSTSTGTLSDRYLLVNTSSGPGVGIVNQTIQFHGTADQHTLSGATSLATLYSSSTAATSYPAVTTRSVGSNGGTAIAFTYDLPRSIVYTRQGNPAYAGLETDGQSPVRPDDLFYPTYVDLNKVAIPQADEQQRLLANIIIQANLSKKPLPRFWYMPKEYKAAVVFALDDHGTTSGTKDIFDKMISNSPSGCSVDDWECYRATSWFYVGIPLTSSQANTYNSQGFEMGVHVQNGCGNFSSFSDLDSYYASQFQDFKNTYPGLPAQTTHRFHCLVWSDWLTQAKVELSRGVRLSLDYYYWPPTWANGRPGMFTGSGMPMRFADTDGTMIDIYQGVSQLVNENGISYTTDVNTLLDNAIGSLGYYGFFGAHDDYRDVTFSNTAISSAKARNVPIISAKQLLTWTDGRNNSYFTNMSWSNNRLSFNVVAATGAKNLRGMLPVNSGSGLLQSITMNGSPITYTTSNIKGITYAFFPAALGTNSYVADYSGTLLATNQPPVAVAGSISEKPSEQDKEQKFSEKLDVSVSPNPSNDLFTIYTNSNNQDPVSIRIFDIFGQLAEKHEKVTLGSTLQVGRSLKGGTYFAEIVQGEQKKIIKLIKLN